MKNNFQEILDTLSEQENVLEHYQIHGKEAVSAIEKIASEEKTEDFTSSLKALEIVAFYARDMETRSAIKLEYPNIFQTLAFCYSFKSDSNQNETFEKFFTQLKTQALRAIGNLTIDDDEARQKILDTEILPLIISDFSASEDSELAKVRTGCMLNTTLGFPPARKLVIENDGVSALLTSITAERLYSGEFMTVFLGVRFLSNIFDEDDGPKAFAAKFENLDQIVKVLAFYKDTSGEFDIPILGYLMEIIELTLTQNEEHQSLILKSGGFDLLCNFLENSNNTASRYPDDKKSLTAIFVIVERCIVLAAAHDDNLILFDNKTFMDRMSRWFQQKADPQLISCAALVIGNLARTDTNCTRLVQEYQLHSIILEVLNSSTDLSLLHAMVGVLKNLAIPVENKILLGNLGIVKLVAPLLEKQTAQPLQFGVVSLLKHLSNRNENNAIAICSEENATNNVLPITELRKVIQKTDNQGIRSEATRALMNITKVIYSSSETYEKYGKILTENTVLKPIVDLVCQTKFPVLQNEALVVLTLLASSQRPDVKDIVDSLLLSEDSCKKDSDDVLTEADTLEIIPFMTALEEITTASKRDYPSEMRQNVLMLIEQLLIFSKNQDVKNDIQRKLNPLLENLCKNSDSEAVQSLSRNLLNTYI